jgi:hypothetical protein
MSEIKKIRAKMHVTDKKCSLLEGKFLDDNSYDTIINSNTDAYDLSGNLLFRYRLNAISMDMLLSGVNAFKDSIDWTEGRGKASGSSHKRILKDGTTSKITVGNKVESGNVGFMDSNAMIRYCRKTAFARNYFDKFQQGIPFVEHISSLYEQYCKQWYDKQMAMVRATDINYLIGNSAFTTVTVNRNFQTAVHKDSGDYREGFGNLIIYREGDWTGSYFCLPQYRIAIDMLNCAVLFVDVHKWHGNTPFHNLQEGDNRIAFVMYYRENMFRCGRPAEELQRTKMEETGYGTL